MADVGPLLRNAVARLADSNDYESGFLASAAHLGIDETEGRLPLVLKSREADRKKGESWDEFKARSKDALLRVQDAVGGAETRFLFAANSISTQLPPEQAIAQGDNPLIDRVELDPVVNPELMDDAIIDVGVAPFRATHGDLTGKGVRVAVLDSGVDTHHPFLDVADSVSTATESTDIPGSHGTHCAGSIASRDAAFPGVAPGVTLLNIKVLRANGSGRHTDIVRGIDEALDREADILSMSLGFNHLPTWSDRGHGWACPDGRCPLCTAVDNAVGFGATVIVAAGNEHERAERLRSIGEGASFDTEYGCPGQARQAITVAALTKTTFLPAGFTSRGPTAYGAAKPQLGGPGVNVMSTIPVPRDAAGVPVINPSRALIFGRKSGTSMATPVVAGAAALIIEQLRGAGLPTTPTAVRNALLTQAVTALTQPADVVGAGRIDLGVY